MGRATLDTCKDKNSTDAEDLELVIRLSLLRMHLIMWVCVHSEDYETSTEVIGRINRVLGEAGFTELAIGDSDGPVSGREFDCAIYEALYGVLGE